MFRLHGSSALLGVLEAAAADVIPGCSFDGVVNYVCCRVAWGFACFERSTCSCTMIVLDTVGADADHERKAAAGQAGPL